MRRPVRPPALPFYTPGMLPGHSAPTVRGEVVSRGIAHWAERRHGGRLPSRHDIDPVDLRGLLPQVLLLDVQRVPWDFRFRVIGGNLIYHLDADWTGEWMSQVPETCPPNELFRNCRQVTETAQPYRSRTPFFGWHCRVRQADGVILPLATDGESVDGLLLFVEFLRADSSTP